MKPVPLRLNTLKLIFGVMYLKGNAEFTFCTTVVPVPAFFSVLLKTSASLSHASSNISLLDFRDRAD